MVEAEDDIIKRIYLYQDNGVTVQELDFECEVLVVPPMNENSNVDQRSKRVNT